MEEPGGRCLPILLGFLTLSASAQPRLLWDNAEPEWGGISRDGRFLSTGSGVRDLVVKTHQAISLQVVRDPALGWREGSVISPDGRRVAYAVFRATEKGGRYSIQVINADGSGEKEVYSGESYDKGKGEFYYLNLSSWSPDGNWIVARENGGVRKEERAILISPHGSGARVAYSTSGEARPFSIMENHSVSPGGRWLAFSGTRRGETEARVYTLALDVAGARPVEITQGRMFDWTPNGSHLVITRSTGGLAQPHLVLLRDGRLAGEVR